MLKTRPLPEPSPATFARGTLAYKTVDTRPCDALVVGTVSGLSSLFVPMPLLWWLPLCVVLALGWLMWQQTRRLQPRAVAYLWGPQQWYVRSRQGWQPVCIHKGRSYATRWRVHLVVRALEGTDARWRLVLMHRRGMHTEHWTRLRRVLRMELADA